MIYRSTRGSEKTCSSSEAVLMGLAPDGGLFMPKDLDWSAFPVEEAVKDPVRKLSERILSFFFDDMHDMSGIVARAYAGKFDTEELTPLTALSVSETGPSGRALTLTAGPGEVQKPAVEFRQAIGFDRLYSTILRDIRLEGDSVILEGAGWGHGAGMEQWGAYVMAEDGADAFAILAHYYPRLQLTQLYD